MPRSANVEADNFYDWLTSTKDANLERVRNSVDSGIFQSGSIGKPSSPVVPNLENNPSLIEDFKERKAIKEIQQQSKDDWQNWQTKRATSQATPLIIGSLAYYFFFR